MATTCLTDEMCEGKENKYYWTWCDRWVDQYQYYPHPNNSCHRGNISELYPNCDSCHNFIDCCANSMEECCDKYYSTFQPTSTPTLSPCSDGCYKKYHFDACYIFEIENTDITCNSDGEFRCCENDRTKCCKFNSEVVFGSFALILIFLSMSIYIFKLYSTITRKTHPEIKMKKIIPV